MSNRAKAILAVMTGNVIFGFSFIFSKMALQITVPSVLVAVRFLMAFLVLNLIVLVGSRIRVPVREEGKGRDDAAAGPQTGPQTRPLVVFSLRGKPLRYVLLLALFQPILYFLCESYGIVYTSSSFAGTIIAVIPVAAIQDIVPCITIYRIIPCITDQCVRACTAIYLIGS